jgi:hypothetical protein
MSWKTPMRTNRVWHLIATMIVSIVIGSPAPLAAQISRLGDTALLTSSVGELHGNDVAYDPVNDVYLVVAAYRSVWGAFVSGSGTPLGNVFLIKAGSDWPTAHYARVKYSPHLTNGTSGSGGFLVTWHEDAVTQGSNIVFARAVAYGVGPTGPELALSSNPTFWNMGAAIAYSETSRRFLVTWTTVAWGIEGRFIDVEAGSGLPSLNTGVLSITPPSGGGAMGAGTAWDPTTDQFGVGYTGWDGSGAFAGFVRVRTGDGLVSGRATFAYSAGTFLSDIDFNPVTGNFVMAWSNSFGSNRAEFTPASGLVGSGLISSTMGTVNSLGLAFNPVSGTFLATGHGATCSAAGVELNSDGAPLSTATALNDCGSGDTGSFFPRPTSRSNERHFAVSFSLSLTKLSFQRIATASTGKGGGGGVSGPAPLSMTSLTASPTLPVFEGTSVTWTASTSGGTAPIQFQFWRFTEGAGWTVGQAYSTSNTFTWTPPAGTHALQVWARSSDSTAAYDVYTSSGPFSVVPTTPSITSLTANVANPATLNTPVTWTAQAVGGAGPLQYQFWRFTPATGWQLGQAYSTSNMFTWSPPLGTSHIQVWVRSATSSAAYDDWRGATIDVSSSPATLTSLTPNFTFYAPSGAQLTWTAVGTGGSGPLEYKFFRYSYNSKSWTVMRDWSPSNQAAWTPEASDSGHHAVQAWVRTIGDTSAYEDWRGTSPFIVTDSTSLTLAANQPLAGLRQGQDVTWVANVEPTGTWEYRFFTFDGSAWTLQQVGLSNAFTWTLTAGTRAIQVWIRRPGPGTLWERWEGSGVFVVSP